MIRHPLTLINAAAIIIVTLKRTIWFVGKEEKMGCGKLP